MLDQMECDCWATAAHWTPRGICPETPGAKTGDAAETLLASLWSTQAITLTSSGHSSGVWV